ncbi:MAG TPA: sulfite exporter TauE/SafE family protein [Nitrosomonas sp.]|nr:sulfite exporter TauE/SafE family protein [Nitrosomonas sp.]HQX13275.1 sulfite exporter TauE/SafE family protein [Nitrosomonas sp.]HRB21485.1 sulfite exporter TauE/SafE family protein [Nitrosomonas sp.]HRB32003.1 sulfite exporter TauE/SafE family protein [Nitrosomonas sp.]HRB45548.1 sulfite exporter TauE/SafE family protein [Nitrosomonas sp.]
MEWWLIYLLTGAFVGFFAGLLGIGGGLIIVPVLISAFTAQDFPLDRIIHMALGTTLATILFTSISSLRTHHRHGAVLWDVVKPMTPGIFLGTLGGTVLVSVMPGNVLSVIFVIFIFYAATQMLLQFRPNPMFQLPRKIGLFLIGTVIGGVSSLVAIGGGLLSVPFLTLCKVKLQQAIGTAAAIGFPIALAGTIGYAVNGSLQSEQLPEYSLGYIYLPALAWLVSASIVTAPIGAKMTHSTKTSILRTIFVVLLYSLGIKMLLNLV